MIKTKTLKNKNNLDTPYATAIINFKLMILTNNSNNKNFIMNKIILPFSEEKIDERVKQNYKLEESTGATDFVNRLDFLLINVNPCQQHSYLNFLSFSPIGKK